MEGLTLTPANLDRLADGVYRVGDYVFCLDDEMRAAGARVLRFSALSPDSCGGDADLAADVFCAMLEAGRRQENWR